jgi:hypothetical protein
MRGSPPQNVTTVAEERSIRSRMVSRRLIGSRSGFGPKQKSQAKLHRLVIHQSIDGGAEAAETRGVTVSNIPSNRDAWDQAESGHG